MRSTFSLNWKLALKAKAKAAEVLKEDRSIVYSHPKRKIRFDSAEINGGKECIDSFAHDNNGPTRIDSNDSKGAYTGRLDENGNRIRHVPCRIWDECLTTNEKYEAFKLSDHYKRWRIMHPESRISLKFFKDNLCPCVKNARFESCVDVYLSQLDHAKQAILKHLRPMLKDVKCTCPYHQRLQLGAQDIIDIAKCSVTKIIKHISCCPSFSHPDLQILNCRNDPDDVRRTFVHFSCVRDRPRKELCYKHLCKEELKELCRKCDLISVTEKETKKFYLSQLNRVYPGAAKRIAVAGTTDDIDFLRYDKLRRAGAAKIKSEHFTDAEWDALDSPKKAYAIAAIILKDGRRSPLEVVPVCDKCGVEKIFEDLNKCPELKKDNGRTYSVNKWVDRELANGNTQTELMEFQMTCAELIEFFSQSLYIARKHYVEKSWKNFGRTSESLESDVLTRVIYTDFAAGVDFHAQETDTGHIDSHGILDVFAVYEFGPCIVFGYEGPDPYENEEGNDNEEEEGNDNEEEEGNDNEEEEEEEDYIFVYKGSYQPPTCKIFQVFGESEEYETSKKGGHDHHFHSDCFDAVNARCDEDRKAKGLPPIKRLVTYTDKCPGQYANQFMIAALATYKKRYTGYFDEEAEIIHRYAVKYAFKSKYMITILSRTTITILTLFVKISVMEKGK